MRRDSSIPFHQVGQFPTRHYVRDTSIFFHSNDENLRYEPTPSVYEQLCVLHYPLIFTGIQNHETPFWIQGEHFGIQIGGNVTGSIPLFGMRYSNLFIRRPKSAFSSCDAASES